MGGWLDGSTDRALNTTLDMHELVGNDLKWTAPNLMIMSIAVPETFGGMKASKWVKI